MIEYAAAGAAGLAIGHVAFPRFLRLFIKHQYGRMLEKEERNRRRERGYFDLEDMPVVPVKERPPPPGPVRGTDVFPDPGPGDPPSMLDAYKETVAIYEMGSKDPVAYIRVADGARVEQMICPECYLGYDYQVRARIYEPGSVPYPDIPADAPKCKHCGGDGKIPVTRMP